VHIFLRPRLSRLFPISSTLFRVAISSSVLFLYQLVALWQYPGVICGALLGGLVVAFLCSRRFGPVCSNLISWRPGRFTGDRVQLGTHRSPLLSSGWECGACGRGSRAPLCLLGRKQMEQRKEWEGNGRTQDEILAPSCTTLTDAFWNVFMRVMGGSGEWSSREIIQNG